MDSDRVSQLLERQASLHGCTKTLHDFASIWADVMDTKNVFFGSLVDDYLRKAIMVAASHRERPFQRQKFTVVDLNVVFSKLSDRIIFRQAHASVFDRGEDGSTNVLVVHGFIRLSKQTVCQLEPGLDCDRSQLGSILGR